MTPQEYRAKKRELLDALDYLQGEYVTTYPVKEGDFLTNRYGHIIRVEKVIIDKRDEYSEDKAPIMRFRGLRHNESYGVCRPKETLVFLESTVTKHEKPNKINRNLRKFPKKGTYDTVNPNTERGPIAK